MSLFTPSSHLPSKLVPHLPPDVARDIRPPLIAVLNDYADCFYVPGDKLGVSRLFKYPIKTKGNNVVNISQPTLPKTNLTKIEVLIVDLLNQGIIQKSTSPYNFPIDLLEKKPDSRGQIKYRLVLDLSALNELADTEASSIPSITDAVDELHGDKYFSVIDLASASYQIELEPQDYRKTAFTTKSGHYEFQRMPVGMKNAPEYTQRLMNEVLKDMKGKVFVCHDDILVHAPTIQEHEMRLRQVLARVRDAGLKLQPGKCQLFRNNVIYLGHDITDQGWGPESVKMKFLRAQKLPSSRKDLETFLGLCGTYSRFLPNYAGKVKALFTLLNSEETSESDCIKYNDEEKKSFMDLKAGLGQNLLLQYPNWEKKFKVRPRFSENAIRATLRQTTSKNSPSDVIAHVSRSYKAAEAKYAVSMQKTLASQWGKEQFRRYLEHTS